MAVAFFAVGVAVSILAAWGLLEPSGRVGLYVAAMFGLGSMAGCLSLVLPRGEP